MSSDEVDLAWMDLALAEAVRAASSDEVPVGAVVVRAGRLLACGRNAMRGTADPSGHAEVRALRSAAARVGNYRLPGTTLYVTLEPCLMCVGTALTARIDRLVYACPDPKAGAAGSIVDLTREERLNHRIHVDSGVRRIEAARLLRDFFGSRRA